MGSLKWGVWSGESGEDSLERIVWRGESGVERMECVGWGMVSRGGRGVECGVWGCGAGNWE